LQHISHRLFKHPYLTVSYLNTFVQHFGAFFTAFSIPHFITSRSGDGGFIPPDMDKVTQFGKVYAGTVLTAYNQEIITARDAIQYFDGLRLKHFEK
jgi:hypothetical protein